MRSTTVPRNEIPPSRPGLGEAARRARHEFLDRRSARGAVWLRVRAIPSRPSASQGGTSMARGTVKYFNDQKGYGFITPEDQESSEVYVHFSAIESGGFRTLHEGERVEFEVVSSTRGNEAAHVLKV